MSTLSELLQRRIVGDINMGKPGARLGSERDLVRRYRTSRATLRKVLAQLEAAGLVYRAPGRSGGIFIGNPKVERDLSDVVGVPAFLARQGIVAGARVVSTKTAMPDSTTQQALGIGADDFVVEVRRLRLADGLPISLEQAQFPARSFPGLLDLQLGGPLYEILETHYGLAISHAHERIESVTATNDEASLLAIEPRSALLLINRVTYDRTGTPCEFSRDLFRGDRTCLAVTVHGSGIGDHSAADVASVALQNKAIAPKAS